MATCSDKADATMLAVLVVLEQFPRLNMKSFCNPPNVIDREVAPLDRGSHNSAHIHGTHVPVEEPSTASNREVEASFDYLVGHAAIAAECPFGPRSDTAILG
jgi:hypothetical protein